jgi:hypothetical protein
MKVIKATNTEAKILNAIRAAKAQGLKIVDGGWHVMWSEEESRFVPESNQCCPLGAVLLASNDMPPNVCDLHDGDDDSSKLTVAASEILGKEVDWCDRFIETFDDPEVAEDHKGANRAALKIRELEYNESYGIVKK